VGRFERGLNRAKADQSVEMYVNQWTLGFGPVGRQAVARLLAEGYQAGVIPKLIVPKSLE
jgi:1,4-dihydroxy-6-naphthoate synthase